MTIACDRCAKEFQKEVPLCEDCWQESAGRRQSFLDALLATIARGPH